MSSPQVQPFPLAVVLLGAVVGYYAGKSQIKTKKELMLFLSVGFALVTVGAVSAGVLFELLKFGLVSVETVGAGFEVLGFGLIVYSIVRIKD